MLKEAIEKILEIGGLEVKEINGRQYSNQKLYPVKYPVSDGINVRSLAGLVEYIKSQFDSKKSIMIHVKSATEVVAFESVNDDMDRNVFIKANALLPEFRFDNFYDTEQFNIKMQSCFVLNDDKDIMLKVVGTIREDNVRDTGDDGVSQSVVVKTGVATVGQAKVPNPVRLKPYRTFVEVEQPESDFVFRMQDGPRCALFEADGGAWELEAMANIEKYLIARLSKEIAMEQVVVIA